jgi:hypothetical protein
MSFTIPAGDVPRSMRVPEFLSLCRDPHALDHVGTVDMDAVYCRACKRRQIEEDGLCGSCHDAEGERQDSARSFQ